MKKNLFFAALLLTATMFFAACNKNDDVTPGSQQEAADLDYNAQNAKSWANYMVQVGYLLQQDATTLNDAWTKSYEGGKAFKEIFLNQQALVCVEQIIDGCSNIANEVGTAKIGDPYDLYFSGKVTEALYAVESWYSWHSRDDYSNNIRSIRNAYFGTRDGRTIAEHSLATIIANNNQALNTEVKDNIQGAINAILAIPDPFRNNIGAPEVQKAMTACANLQETLGKLKKYIQSTPTVNTDAVLHPILETYVNDVVLPTYSDLQQANTALYHAAQAFQQQPSNATFEACCNAWFEAREPWESSEAFLFGPVDALGLDPNMDSWPLDQDAIVNILNSGKFDNLTWSDGDDDDEIEAVQSVRGFHTMEFLIFKDGKARRVN